MDSKTTLFAIVCLLGMALLVQSFDNGTRHDADAKPGRRYKRMYVMCPPKFSRIGNECYYISPGKQNWLDAYFECKDHNSKLAEPMKYEDKHLRRYLQKINLSENLWIGGTYNWKVNKWQWGHNGRDIEYQSFSQMVPGKDLKYNCALLRSDLKFRWSAQECTNKNNFICQHRMPLVSENGRYSLYDKWNKTYPDQKANEKVVYIMDEPIDRNQSNNSVKPRIFNSRKRVLQSNPSIRPRPEHRRKPYLKKKLPVQAAAGPYYIPSEVVVGRKQHLAQYAPDTPNDINTIDNGHRNGYHHSVSQFNVDFTTRNGKNRLASLPGGYRPGYGTAAHMETRGPHQHRHQPGQHKTTKRTHYFMPTRPPTTPSTSTAPATTTTTTSTTTTTTPRPQTTTSWPMPTKRIHYPPLTTNHMLKQHTAHPMSTDERKLKRERLRERLQRLSYEEQLLFFQDRANRKKLKEQQQRDQQRDNEVVQ
ncbi:uncharacterized protein LOC128306011 isoform X2 [Anopheles moucheti]|uniref:uncharacterized protein LOC128306011 isoform X2 n=1 Tax=Anopheles moucheti TaxID=186751 RepID=UPI0022F056D1|nr:uncharacterized protein LOC128306011 isoform X2 [Anopheles moucheti]